MKFFRAALAAVVFVGGLGLVTFAQDGKMAGHDGASEREHVLLMPDDLKWTDGPATLPAGAKQVVLHGDPKNEGIFAMRLKLPKDFKIPTH